MEQNVLEICLRILKNFVESALFNQYGRRYTRQFL